MLLAPNYSHKSSSAGYITVDDLKDVGAVPLRGVFFLGREGGDGEISYFKRSGMLIEKFKLNP